MSLGILSGDAIEVDQELWFLNKPKLEYYIKKVTSFADYTVEEYGNIIQKHFPNENIFYKLSYNDLTNSKYPIHTKHGATVYYFTIQTIKSLKTNDVDFYLPKSDEDIQIAKRLITFNYSSLEPVNRKLKWAVFNDEIPTYINVKFNAIGIKSGFDIKLQCRIDSVNETAAIADQVYTILGNRNNDYQLSKQFITYVKESTEKSISKKTFTLYINNFDILNDLFFLFNRNDISIENINFYHGKNKDFSDYIKNFCELPL
jgi:predicted nucleic-acid-binding protein